MHKITKTLAEINWRGHFRSRLGFWRICHVDHHSHTT